MDAGTHHLYMHNWEGTATTMVNASTTINVWTQQINDRDEDFYTHNLCTRSDSVLPSATTRERERTNDPFKRPWEPPCRRWPAPRP